MALNFYQMPDNTTVQENKFYSVAYIKKKKKAIIFSTSIRHSFHLCYLHYNEMYSETYNTETYLPVLCGTGSEEEQSYY